MDSLSEDPICNPMKGQIEPALVSHDIRKLPVTNEAFAQAFLVVDEWHTHPSHLATF